MKQRFINWLHSERSNPWGFRPSDAVFITITMVALAITWGVDAEIGAKILATVFIVLGGLFGFAIDHN